MTWEQLEPELTDIFLNEKKLEKQIGRLSKLGIKTVYKKGNHPKFYITKNGITHCITHSCSSSDINANRQTLRRFRRVIKC